MSRLNRLRPKGNTLQVLRSLTSRDVKGQYKRTLLGRLWSLINPLAQIAIYGLVFGLLFNARPAEGLNSGMNIYGVWLGVGIIVWNYINSGIREAMTSYTSYSGLLKKVYLPRWTLPLSKVLSRTITFLSELAVLTLVCGIFGSYEVLYRLVMLIPLILLTGMFVYGLGLILGIALVYFRDIEHFWTIATQAWFYGSGVMFPLSVVVSAQKKIDDAGHTIFGMPIPLLEVFQLNPAFEILTAYRRVLYDYAWPDLSSMIVIAGWAVGMLLVGTLVYNRFQARIVEEL